MAITDAPKIVTARLEYDDSHTLERYLATGGYEGLRKALTMTPEAVAAEVDAARLPGRAQVVDAAQEPGHLPGHQR
jgi:NADH-quinone oxidoreductase subunit F